MKSVLGFALAAVLLAGCAPITLEQAQAACREKGGFLTIFQTQSVTRSGEVGPLKQEPGKCIMPEEFKNLPPGTVPKSAAAPPAAPAPAPATN